MGSLTVSVSVIVLLFYCSFIEAAEYHDSPAPAPADDHGHHPVAAPSPQHNLPPSQSPVPHHLPPSPSPHHALGEPPKSHPYLQRSFIEVQGVVYCKSCKYRGVETLLGAKPLIGATVQLTCKNTKYAPVVEIATTDKNGYFRLAPKNVSSYAYHRCKVYLVKSPDNNCITPSKLNGGADGSELKPVRAFFDEEKKPVVLYSVGPLAYEPTCPR